MGDVFTKDAILALALLVGGVIVPAIVRGATDYRLLAVLSIAGLVAAVFVSREWALVTAVGVVVVGLGLRR